MRENKIASNIFSKKKSNQTTRDPNDFFFESDSSINHAEVLHNEGLQKLKNGDVNGCELFELAFNLEPTNHELLYSQGVSLYNHGKKSEIKKYLLQANKKIQKMP